ncbi:MAG: type III-A CRISPR-associated protein Cas10/Csm1 [Rhodocyclaceae bacterium]|nr:type III-A CRISPR-associated protein Cas10/Csm1 [Rhodocyclaceae bacterium]
MSNDEKNLLVKSCRVALAGLLHDLGKFAERARLDFPQDKLDAHVTLYCRFHSQDGKHGYHSHKHAAYTGLAFDLVEQNAPDLIAGEMQPFANREALSSSLQVDSLLNAAAAHHQPETFLQWIVATADRMASGFEREEFERYNAAADEGGKGKGKYYHYRARQLTLFEQIHLTGSAQPARNVEDLHWRYPLRAIAPETIFPQKRAECEMGEGQMERAQKEYRQLWDEFLRALERIPASHRSQWPLWLDHFDSVWLAFTHAIPSATAFGAKPEVSLYDHCKATAVLAVALWRWHEEHQQTGDEAIRRLKERRDWDEEKLLLVQGDFFGIQDFIFAEGSQTNRNAARLLRGRSFQVSLFCELAALKVLEALQLPPTSQITNAAGKFLIVAPNTESARKALAQVRHEINDWFLQHSFGLAGLGLAWKAASSNDLCAGRFGDLMKALFDELEAAKLHRFDLTASASPVFQTEYPHGVCQSNHRLPADRAEGEHGSAALSRDQIKLGELLTREDRLMVLRDEQSAEGIKGRFALELPVFGYRVAFTANEEVTGKFGPWAKDGTLVRCWDFSLPQSMTETLWHGYARRFINAYVPRFGAQDQQTADKYRGVQEGEAQAVHVDAGKTFQHIACEDRLCPEAPDKWQGQVALMTLKGDVDNLGQIFQQGLQSPTFAKMAALSRQMNAFFAIWLPALCETEFPNTYTVFAGGDDFFLIGPWRTTQRLAQRMAEAFRHYVAENPDITFSAGMVMTKPDLPVHTLATQAEEALDKAKASAHENPRERKNAVVVFNERVRWPDWHKVAAAEAALDRLREDYQLSTGYVYGLLHLLDLRADTNNPEHAMWRSRFAYRTRRFVVDRLREEKRQAAQRDLAEDIGQKGIEELNTRYRIPLFNHFYRQR